MTERIILRSALESSLKDQWAPLVEALGFSIVASSLDFMQAGDTAICGTPSGVCQKLHRIGSYEVGTARAGLWLAEIPDWGRRPADRERARRRTAKALVELSPARDRNVLMILTTPGIGDIELILPRQRTKGALGTIRAEISRANPNRHHLELLESLTLAPQLATAAITRQWSDAFDVDRVTNAFYQQFRLLRNRMVEAIRVSNSDHPMLNPPDSDEAGLAELRRYVTRNLGRMLFLWFIQAKRWLDNDPSYLMNLYARSVGASQSFFPDALIPLFFDTLAVEESRPPQAKRLGDLPYLNGGLFVPMSFEDRLYGTEREHVDISIPNEIFDPRSHDDAEPTVLGLLSSYRFTTQESTPDDMSVDPDPELLGKVFENLIEERKKTGTFYTPREVVRFMCREALDGYIMEKAGVTKEVLGDLRLEALDPANTDLHLSAKERGTLRNALLSVTVCDPAVGSGAFPVGMMQEIVQLLIGIEQSADVLVHIGGQQVAEWKEHIITNCLYGVDINLEAVEICQLRLWLSLVVDAERPMPLPNLDFRFEAGDSLVDRVGNMRLPGSLPREKHQGEMLFGELADIEHELEGLRERYATVRDSREARRLRDEVKSKQLQLVEAQMRGLMQGIEKRSREVRKRIDELVRMGAGARELHTLEKESDELASRRSLLGSVIEALSPDATFKKPFLWPVEFPEVFEAGGFDIVVANPPYVRQEKLSAEDQFTFAESYPSVHSGTADLLVYFFARALHILKDEGRIAFITSNKFHRAGYGEGLREYLPNHMRIERVIDFGDLSVFDAIAYPSILIGAKGPAAEEARVHVARLTHAVRRDLADSGTTENVATVRERLEDLDGLLERDGIHDFPQVLLRKDGWILEDPKLIRLFDRLMKSGTPLGEFVQGRMYRGVLTGLNEAFVIDEARRAELIAADARSAELIKPWLRGRDIKRWNPESAGLYLIAIQNSGDADCRTPWRTAATEKEARRIFREQYPAIHKHVSGFEDGLRPRADQGRWWWELRSCTYYKEFEQPKILWGNMAIMSKFSLDYSGAFVGAPANILSRPEPWLIALMNSIVLDFLYPWVTVERSGGYQEFKLGYISPVPIIVPPKAIQSRLESLVQFSLERPDSLETNMEIDELVVALYMLSGEELTLVKQTVATRRALAGAVSQDAEEEVDA